MTVKIARGELSAVCRAVGVMAPKDSVELHNIPLEINVGLKKRDDNPCVVIPTGGGKTPVIATICRDSVGPWNGRVVILAHVKELLEQAADKLRHIAPDVPVGIYSAGLKRKDLGYAVTIAGIQSIY